MAVSLMLLPLYSRVLICKDAEWTPRSRRTFGFKSCGLPLCHWNAAPDASKGRSAFIASHQTVLPWRQRHYDPFTSLQWHRWQNLKSHKSNIPWGFYTIHLSSKRYIQISFVLPTNPKVKFAVKFVRNKTRLTYYCQSHSNNVP